MENLRPKDIKNVKKLELPIETEKKVLQYLNEKIIGKSSFELDNLSRILIILCFNAVAIIYGMLLINKAFDTPYYYLETSITNIVWNIIPFFFWLLSSIKFVTNLAIINEKPKKKIISIENINLITEKKDKMFLIVSFVTNLGIMVGLAANTEFLMAGIYLSMVIVNAIRLPALEGKLRKAIAKLDAEEIKGILKGTVFTVLFSYNKTFNTYKIINSLTTARNKIL